MVFAGWVNRPVSGLSSTRRGTGCAADARVRRAVPTAGGAPGTRFLPPLPSSTVQTRPFTSTRPGDRQSRHVCRTSPFNEHLSPFPRGRAAQCGCPCRSPPDTSLAASLRISRSRVSASVTDRGQVPHARAPKTKAITCRTRPACAANGRDCHAATCLTFRRSRCKLPIRQAAVFANLCGELNAEEL